MLQSHPSLCHSKKFSWILWPQQQQHMNAYTRIYNKIKTNTHTHTEHSMIICYIHWEIDVHIHLISTQILQNNITHRFVKDKKNLFQFSTQNMHCKQYRWNIYDSPPDGNNIGTTTTLNRWRSHSEKTLIVVVYLYIVASILYLRVVLIKSYTIYPFAYGYINNSTLPGSRAPISSVSPSSK